MVEGINLSILIPTHNYDCTALVKDLAKQMPKDAELIVADDGSTDHACVATLETINTIPQCRLWKAEKNMGRSAIRNKLAEIAKGQWLIFIDSDAQVWNEHYLQHYLESTSSDVICGGVMSPEQCPSPSVSLRYRYEKHFWDKHLASVRSQRPYDNFTAFNFMIRRELFLKIQFSDKIKGYGHEDTLFGQELCKRHIPIAHINNELIHAGLDSNAEYLRKTEESILSLKGHSEELYGKSALLDTYGRIEHYGAAPLLRLWHKCFAKLEKANLCSSRPNLLVFKIYKLGYCAKVMQKK